MEEQRRNVVQGQRIGNDGLQMKSLDKGHLECQIQML
jgi:hypothetical protein